MLLTTRIKNLVYKHTFMMFVCDICKKSYSSKCNLKRHKTEIHEYKDENYFYCTHEGCTKRYKYEKSRDRHIKFKHLGESLNCPYCGKLYKSVHGLNIHVNLHINGGYRCKYSDDCGVFVSRFTLQKHIQTVHRKMMIPCKYAGCDRKFRHTVSMKRHIIVDHLKKKFKCKYPGCNVEYCYEESMKRHVSSKHLKKKYYCIHPNCSREFGSRQSLKEHVKNKHSEETLQCMYVGCNKEFSQPSELKMHVKRNHMYIPNNTIIHLDGLEDIIGLEES